MTDVKQASPKSVGLSSERLENFDFLLKEKYVDKGKLPGAQILIARGGKVIIVTNEINKVISENVRFTLEMPETGEHLAVFLMTIPLQLLAYHVASLKNCDIDKPRNLAKSVTVE